MAPRTLHCSHCGRETVTNIVKAGDTHGPTELEGRCRGFWITGPNPQGAGVAPVNVLGDKPFCLYVSEAMTKRHGDGSKHFYPGIVVEDQPGYYMTDWDYGSDFAEAAATVIATNAARGISQVGASEIVGSSMRASRS
jgi:hypothetical protein